MLSTRSLSSLSQPIMSMESQPNRSHPLEFRMAPLIKLKLVSSTLEEKEMGRQLHVVFLPFMAHGHMIPTVDMAKLFASHGVKATIVTTPLNVPLLSEPNLNVATIRFPSAAGLPEGCENMDSIGILAKSSGVQDPITIFINATKFLQEPLERLLQDTRPDCIVADVFFPWATDAAAEFGIPRLVFHGTGFFSLCASASIRLYSPYKAVSSDSEPFVIPGLPGEIKITKKQLPSFAIVDDGAGETEFQKLIRHVMESDSRSYGVVVNSFYELEPAYADHYREVLKQRAWHIGPVSLCNRNRTDRAARGKEAAIDEHECLNWLDSKKPNSVIYLCFGSVANFNSNQLLEIAKGLEASGQQFVWVVRKEKTEDPEWLPEGFEDRTAGKGLIIRGWAPQVMILEHEAVGGFLTHCGWNSTLEGVAAGVPMVTWPVSAEQFYNEKLITEVLRIGVGVGVQQWMRLVGDFVSGEKVEKAVTAVMAGERTEEMRNRSKELGQTAREAVEESGSSYCELEKLIQELST